MVRETGHAAEQFLRSVATGQADDHQAERDQRAAAALERVNTSPDWQNDCRSTHDCIICFAHCHVAERLLALTRQTTAGDVLSAKRDEQKREHMQTFKEYQSQIEKP